MARREADCLPRRVAATLSMVQQASCRTERNGVIKSVEAKGIEDESDASQRRV
jgi:hypothetical protein